MRPAQLVQSIECGGDDHLPRYFPTLLSSIVLYILMQVDSWHIPRCYGSSGSSDKWSVRIPSLDLYSHILPELALSSSLTSLDSAYMSGFDWCLNGPLPFLGLDLWTSFLGSDSSLPQDPLRKKTNLLILSNFPGGVVIFLKVGEVSLSQISRDVCIIHLLRFNSS